MNINYKETQYSFLENSSASSRDPRGPRVLSAQMVLSLENLVIFSIASIMVMIFCFSLGVERGKRFVSSGGESTENVAARELPQKPDPEAMSDEDAVAPSQEAKKNIFGTLLASVSGKEKTESSDVSAVEKKAAATLAEAKPAKAVQIVKAPDKAVKSEPAVTAVKPLPSGSFTVQVASYKSEQFAQREVQNLKQKGYRDIYVLPKGSFVIVCVGNFLLKSDASTLTQKLKDRYGNTLVRRL